MKDGSKIAKKTFVCVAGVAVGLAAFAARHPELIASESERVKLPVWSGGGWTAGYCPSKIRACECSVSGAILPESVTKKVLTGLKRFFGCRKTAAIPI